MNLMIDQIKTCTHTPKINQSKKNEKNIMKRTEEILMKKNEKIRQKREQIAQEKENLEISDCTFQPNINRKLNKTYLKNKRDVSDLMAWQKSKDDKLFDSLLEKSKKDQELTPFAPTISDNSKKMAETKYSHQKVEERLYEGPKSRPITPKPCRSSASSNKGGVVSRKHLSKSPMNFTRNPRNASFTKAESKTSFETHEPLRNYDFGHLGQSIDSKLVSRKGSARTPIPNGKDCLNVTDSQTYNTNTDDLNKNVTTVQGKKVALDSSYDTSSMDDHCKGVKKFDTENFDSEETNWVCEVESDSYLGVEHEIQQIKESYQNFANVYKNSNIKRKGVNLDYSSHKVSVKKPKIVEAKKPCKKIGGSDGTCEENSARKYLATGMAARKTAAAKPEGQNSSSQTLLDARKKILNEKYQENVTEPAQEQISEKVEEVLVSERTRLDLEYEKLRDKYFTSEVGDHSGFEDTGAHGPYGLPVGFVSNKSLSKGRAHPSS